MIILIEKSQSLQILEQKITKVWRKSTTFLNSERSAALAANAAAFGRSLRWVFQGFPTSEKKGAKECERGRSPETQKNATTRAIGVDAAGN